MQHTARDSANDLPGMTSLIGGDTGHCCRDGLCVVAALSGARTHVWLESHPSLVV